MAEKRRAEEKQNGRNTPHYERRMEPARRAGIAVFDDVPRVQIGTDVKKKGTARLSFLERTYLFSCYGKERPAKFGDFVVLDTETTGLSLPKDAELEVAAIKVKNYKFVEVFHTMITPPQKLSTDSAREAMSVNGITPEMLEGADAVPDHPVTARVHRGYAASRSQSEFDFKIPVPCGFECYRAKTKVL